ncbi:MAG: hydrogenase expression/formation protein HypE [Verrucomicrobiales bacterium]|nr:hydrogenase expression/formation protein HypE [Verrucomicrobiales bacterium]
MDADFASQCPAPWASSDTVTLAHGGGGSLGQRLLDRLFRPHFSNPVLATAHDASVLPNPAAAIAVSTDSFVVRPLEFPGGDIGHLAICGTVNDLLMAGARPRWLSAAFILEEGLPMTTLARVVASMARTARRAGVEIVTGDTKVVDRGHGDGIYINTTGIGVLTSQAPIAPSSVQPGDAILLSGDLGRHGVAILSVREGLKFESTIESDCDLLLEPVEALLRAGLDIHCLRDLTRGGLGAALHEIAATRQVSIDIDSEAVPVCEAVRGACEVLGLDPLHVANEGRFVLFLPATQAGEALRILRQFRAEASRIGSVRPLATVPVSLRNAYGTTRVLPYLSGEQLPRIC